MTRGFFFKIKFEKGEVMNQGMNTGGRTPEELEMAIHKFYMTRALELAALGEGRTNPNPLVGAVIVKEGRIIGEGYHEKCGEAHAEVNAVRNATESVVGSTMYVTLEPCSHTGKTPPCADLIIREKIKKVVIAVLDPNPLVCGRGVRKLEDAGIEVISGVLEEESRKQNEIFMKYILEKKPFLLYKGAMTLDGKIATVTGESQWISSEESRKKVHQLRNRFKGIMVGVDTVIADDPQLTCRLEEGRNPIRIVVDSNLRIPLDATILTEQEQAKTIIATCNQTLLLKPELVETLLSMGITLVGVEEKEGRVYLPDLMEKLGEMGIDGILLEGGGTLAFSAFSQEVVDKIRFYVAPKILGGSQAKTLVEGAGIPQIEKAISMWDMEVSNSGGDLQIEAYVRKSHEDTLEKAGYCKINLNPQHN